MRQISRRHFIQTGIVGAAAVSAGFTNLSYASLPVIDKVKLGKVGLLVSRLALGTGTHGGDRKSVV